MLVANYQRTKNLFVVIIFELNLITKKETKHLKNKAKLTDSIIFFFQIFYTHHNSIVS